MFRFTQEPSSGSSPMLSQNYKYVFSVLVGIDCVYTNEHRLTMLVVLAKHKTAP